MRGSPRAAMAHWRAGAVAGHAGARFVARLAALTVPRGRDAMHAHGPRAGVVGGLCSLVARRTRALLVAQLAVAAMPYHFGPLGPLAVFAGPRVAVCARFELSRVFAVTAVAGRVTDLHTVFSMARDAVFIGQHGLTSHLLTVDGGLVTLEALERLGVA